LYVATEIDITNIAREIMEELRELENGEATTTLCMARELGFLDLTDAELIKLHENVFYFAKRNKIQLDMSANEDQFEGVPYNREYLVFNKKAQIKCPYCGGGNTIRILYGKAPDEDWLQKKMNAGKIRYSNKKVILSNVGGYTLDNNPHRYCKDCKKGFAKSPVYYDKDTKSWKIYSDQVKSVRFLIGGYFGGRVEVLIEEDGKGAKVSVNNYPEMPEGIYDTEDRRITGNKWAGIVIDLYSRMYLHEWEQRYTDPDILDGEQWELEVKLKDGHEEIYSGSNAYPPYWPELKKIFRAYTKF